MTALGGSGHDAGNLVGLLTGDLGRVETVAVARHLRSCPRCAGELVELAVAHGSLAAGRRTAAVLSGGPGGPSGRLAGGSLPASVPPGRTARSGRWPWRPLTAVAVTVALALGGLATLGHRTPPSPVVARAALKPLDAPASASGSIRVSDQGGSTRALTVRTRGLPPPGRGQFYEVWLLDPATSKMLPMGVLPPSGAGAYAVRADIMAGYSAVDVSLQADDGNPAHSPTSALRAVYRSA